MSSRFSPPDRTLTIDVFHLCGARSGEADTFPQRRSRNTRPWLTSRTRLWWLTTWGRRLTVTWIQAGNHTSAPDRTDTCELPVGWFNKCSFLDYRRRWRTASLNPTEVFYFSRRQTLENDPSNGYRTLALASCSLALVALFLFSVASSGESHLQPQFGHFDCLLVSLNPSYRENLFIYGLEASCFLPPV